MRIAPLLRPFAKKPELAAFLLFAAVYAAFHCYSFLSVSAFVPDEVVILRTLALQRELYGPGWPSLLRVNSEWAYGSSFWLTGLMLEGLYPLRLLNLGFLLSVPALYFALGRNRAPEGTGTREVAAPALYAVALWLTFPLAWFTGKLIGPELMSLSLGFLSIVLLSRGRLGLFALALGASIAVKANALVFAAYAAPCLALYHRRDFASWRTPARLAAGLAAGYAAGNPYALVSPSGAFDEMRAHVPRVAANFHAALFSDAWTWDGVHNGGFFHILFPVAAFALFLGVLTYLRRGRLQSLLPLAAASLVSLLLIVNSNAYAWYWFPLAALLPLGLADLDYDDRRCRALAGLLIAANLAGNAAQIYLQAELRHRQIVNIAQLQDTVARMNHVIGRSGLPYDRIVDLTDVNAGATIPDIDALKSFATLRGPCFIKLGGRLARVHGLGWLVEEARAGRSNLAYLARCNDVDVLYLKGSLSP